MAHYDLSQLSDLQFQQLAQALAMEEFGSRFVSTGAGSDGRRDGYIEFSLKEGKDFKQPWSGYTVIQVKHKCFTADPSADADWLVNQLSAEFQSFSATSQTLCIPRNYIVVTNIRLSFVPKTLVKYKDGRTTI